MIGKILLVLGVLLLVSGAALTVSSSFMFTFTNNGTQTIQVPKSQVIMDYSFQLPGYASNYKLVQIQMTRDKTLYISATGNKPFFFSIVNYTSGSPPDYPDETYVNIGSTASVNTQWNPPLSGSYFISFHVPGYDYNNLVTISAQVTARWTASETSPVTKTEQRTLINPSFTYAGYGLIALGGVMVCIGLLKTLHRRSN